MVSSAVLYLNTFLLLDLNACVFSLGELTRRRDTLHQTFETLGRIDSCLAIASFRAGSAAYCKPDFVPPGKTLSCRDAFHPLLDHPVPQSFDLAGRSLLVYGANMAGKTTFARALALNALLAQTLDTCTAAVYRAPFFRLRTFINRGDDVLEGKSYYMAEVEAVGHMVEAAARRADRPHLFVLDEPFKGTNARERLAASLAVLEYLDGHGHLCIAATHDERLGQALQRQWDIRHLQGHMADGALVFDYRLRPGFDYSANAIHLLEARNYPAGLVRRARELVDGNDKNQGQTDEP